MSNHLKGVGVKDVRNTYQMFFHDHLKNKTKRNKDKLILWTRLKL